MNNMSDDFQKVISDSPAVLVDFYADWCAPCKMVIPVLEDVVNHFDGKVKLHKVDIDTHIDLSKSMHILSVPTLVLFKNGNEVWRMRGFDIAPTLVKTIEQHL
jgi:thioredoxin 1